MPSEDYLDTGFNAKDFDSGRTKPTDPKPAKAAPRLMVTPGIDDNVHTECPDCRGAGCEPYEAPKAAAQEEADTLYDRCGFWPERYITNSMCSWPKCQTTLDFKCPGKITPVKQEEAAEPRAARRLLVEMLPGDNDAELVPDTTLHGIFHFIREVTDEPLTDGHPLDDALGNIHSVAIALQMHGQNPSATALAKAHEEIQNYLLNLRRL
jgi:hypothetical protein